MMSHHECWAYYTHLLWAGDHVFVPPVPSSTAMTVLDRRRGDYRAINLGLSFSTLEDDLALEFSFTHAPSPATGEQFYDFSCPIPLYTVFYNKTSIKPRTHFCCFDFSVDSLGWDGMGCNVMWWDGMWWDGMWCDGMGCDGMGWDMTGPTKYRMERTIS